MVQGLAFLSKKGFNPQNTDNRKRVWEAQQASKQEEERVRKRHAQLKKEKEEEELEESLKGSIGGQQAQLRFMYDAPPGMIKANDDATVKDDDDKKQPAKAADSYEPSALNRLAQASTGDDAAAAAFRQMLASSVQNQNDQNYGADGEESSSAAEQSFKFAPVLQGSSVDAVSRIGKGKGVAVGANMDGRSALEKAVGRKDRSQNLSYQDQIERFPQLKNAPMAQNMKKVAAGDGDAAPSAPMMVNFKPLGAKILHVRCLACGIWGHQRGDRECAKSGWNPFALPSHSSKEPANSSKMNMASSSIMPDTKSSKATPAIDNHKQSTSHRRHDDDDSDSDREMRRRHQRHQHHRSRKHSRRKDRDDSSKSDDESSVNERRRSRTPSSEDSHNLKRQEDHDYSDMNDDDDRRDRKRQHKSSKKKKKRKYERRESSKRK